MALEVRKLSESDAGGIAMLILESYDNGTGMWFAKRPSREEADAVVARKLDMLRKSLLIDNVAMLNGELVGDCEVVVDKQMGLLGILVKSEYRDAGVGKSLLLASLKDCVRMNVAVVVAEVEESNVHAIGFFTRNGFMISGNEVVERNGKASMITRLEFRVSAGQ